MSEILTVVKQNVERIAKEKNKNVEEVLKEAGVSFDSKHFGIVDVDRIAHVLDVNVAMLFEEKKTDR